MNSAQAVIDGEEKRAEMCMQLLTSSIRQNKSVISQDVTFHLTNDGQSWKPADFEPLLGECLFGCLSGE